MEPLLEDVTRSSQTSATVCGDSGPLKVTLVGVNFFVLASTLGLKKIGRVITK